MFVNSSVIVPETTVPVIDMSSRPGTCPYCIRLVIKALEQEKSGIQLSGERDPPQFVLVFSAVSAKNSALVGQGS